MTDQPIQATYLVKVVLRDGTDEGSTIGKPPTNEQIEAAIEGCLRTEYPDFIPSATSERTDK